MSKQEIKLKISIQQKSIMSFNKKKKNSVGKNTATANEEGMGKKKKENTRQNIIISYISSPI